MQLSIRSGLGRPQHATAKSVSGVQMQVVVRKRMSPKVLFNSKSWNEICASEAFGLLRTHCDSITRCDFGAL